VVRSGRKKEPRKRRGDREEDWGLGGKAVEGGGEVKVTESPKYFRGEGRETERTRGRTVVKRKQHKWAEVGGKGPKKDII